MPKNIQIPEKLFLELVRYHLLDIPNKEEYIKKELETKLEAMVKRELYTKYTLSENALDKEKLLQEYLSHK